MKNLTEKGKEYIYIYMAKIWKLKNLHVSQESKEFVWKKMNVFGTMKNLSGKNMER